MIYERAADLPGEGGSIERGRVKVGVAYHAAMERYQARPYAGSIQLFMPRRRFVGFKDPLGGWGPVAPGRVELFPLAANPRGCMVEPHAEKLAVALDRRISSGPGPQAGRPPQA